MIDENEFLTRAGKWLETLPRIDFKEYGDEAIPSPTDDLLVSLIDLYYEATPLQREIIRTSNCDWESATRAINVLATYAVRMTMCAARRGSDWCRSDPRDAGYYVVPLLIYSGKRIGANLERLFGIGREMAVDPVTKALMVVSKEYSGQEILDMIGWAEFEGPAGVIFYPKGQPIPKSQMGLS